MLINISLYLHQFSSRTMNLPSEHYKISFLYTILHVMLDYMINVHYVKSRKLMRRTFSEDHQENTNGQKLCLIMMSTEFSSQKKMKVTPTFY